MRLVVAESVLTFAQDIAHACDAGELDPARVAEAAGRVRRLADADAATPWRPGSVWRPSEVPSPGTAASWMGLPLRLHPVDGAPLPTERCAPPVASLPGVRELG
jgi:hypothetical protein